MNFPALIIPSSATSPANLYKRIIIQDDNIIMDTALKKTAGKNHHGFPGAQRVKKRTSIRLS